MKTMKKEKIFAAKFFMKGVRTRKYNRYYVEG